MTDFKSFHYGYSSFGTGKHPSQMSRILSSLTPALRAKLPKHFLHLYSFSTPPAQPVDPPEQSPSTRSRTISNASHAETPVASEVEKQAPVSVEQRDCQLSVKALMANIEITLVTKQKLAATEAGGPVSTRLVAAAKSNAAPAPATIASKGLDENLQEAAKFTRTSGLVYNTNTGQRAWQMVDSCHKHLRALGSYLIFAGVQPAWIPSAAIQLRMGGAGLRVLSMESLKQALPAHLSPYYPSILQSLLCLPLDSCFPAKWLGGLLRLTANAGKLRHSAKGMCTAAQPHNSMTLVPLSSGPPSVLWSSLGGQENLCLLWIMETVCERKMHTSLTGLWWTSGGWGKPHIKDCAVYQRSHAPWPSSQALVLKSLRCFLGSRPAWISCSLARSYGLLDTRTSSVSGSVMQR
ncbi:hypothetical protein K438DRAFT_797227 [Mycena galopus ATCC 62051]|nr:hypothetical protein K438DRAFT_797227 [Mycena galopus ATCC 62051]